MASNLDSRNEDQGDLSDIKRKLAWRMGFAGLMIVALLGGLALFDYLSVQVETEPAPPQFTEPVPVPKIGDATGNTRRIRCPRQKKKTKKRKTVQRQKQVR